MGKSISGRAHSRLSTGGRLISATASNLHWNYFLALERDMELVSRYIEFAEPNFTVYSIELAHLLFAAGSEVDVVAKLVCAQVAPGHPTENIDDYSAALLPALPNLPTTTVFVPRYGLSFNPWENWANNRNPDWWRAYNKVKHERDTHFSKATLQNALNALGALLIFSFHYYSRKLSADAASVLAPKETTLRLTPQSSLFRLDEQLYYSTVIS
jgi:hypothetical protein